MHNMTKRRQPVPTWRTPDTFEPFGIVITYGILEQQCGVVDDSSTWTMSVVQTTITY